MIAPVPPPPRHLVSTAAARLAALANPGRIALLAEVLRRQAAGEECTLGTVGAALGVDIRTLVRQAVVLAEAKILVLDGQRLAADLAMVQSASDRLVASLPVSALLDSDPDLARFFTFGRLESLPLITRVEERRRLAAVLVQLIPADRSLTEEEVNATLSEVMDDFASLRRFLVDQGVLDRSAGRDYRRVDA